MGLVTLKKQGHIAVITMENAAKLNALSTSFLQELCAVFRAVEEDRDLFVVVITGCQKAFIAGADISEMATLSAAEALVWGKLGTDLNLQIERLRVPVIAAINGFCLGGGFEMALACDIRLASERARIGLTEVNMGVIPGSGGTQRLPRLIGPSRAKLLMMTGNHYKGEAALAMGLVDMVFPAEELLEAAVNMAKEMAAKPPLALEYVKWAVNEGMQMDLDRALLFESALFAHLYSTEDQKEAMSAFLEKRPTRPFQGK